MKKIIEEIQHGDFSNLNKLSESQQIELMKTWDRSRWIKYCMQNTITEEEVFKPIFKLIESIY